ncbi:PH domain-containing protein [Microbacterium hominis]|uniref:PH domain-containing protein n=2 Tax=Microbacterium hominis TaxID=162426 RepID=A0A7D4PW23_9MICO|nr:PH domain-containing protein [Microbacterium hominis]
MHPLTPLLRGGIFLLVLLGIVVSNLRDRIIYVFLPGIVPGIDPEDVEDFETGDVIDFVLVNDLIVVALVVVLLVLLVLVAMFYTMWRFHTFRITDDDVEVRSGVLFRTQRRAPLDRVQGVNLTRPMIARLFGLAKLEVVGAGADANVKLEYLPTTSAETVRADILRLASGRRLAAAEQRSATAERAGSRVAALGQTVSRGITGLIEGDEAPVDEPESVVDIPLGRLMLSHVFSPATIGLIVAAAAIGIGVSRGAFWLLFAFVPALIGYGAYWVRSIVRSLRYSIAPTPDGVRITFGLLTTVTENVPPGRVHAIEISQSILWRPAGWWTVRINRLSGRNASDAVSADQFTTVLPVGTSADVERVLRLLLPHLPEDEWPLIVREGMLGPTVDDTFTNTPRRARLMKPFSYRRNGFRLTEGLLILRRGVVWRKLAVLPLARMQSVGIDQGPLDRLFDVAGLRAHVVAGPVTTILAAVDRAQAVALFGDAAQGAVRAASDDHTHRWAQETER